MTATHDNDVFQLSAVSQNDPGAADGANIYCTIKAIHNGTLRQGSFPLDMQTILPVPPGQTTPAPATPTWFLVPSGMLKATGFTLEIGCLGDPAYPTTKIDISATDVAIWAGRNAATPTNEIYQTGVYGIFGYAQSGPDGLIYTVTVGVLDPRKHP